MKIALINASPKAKGSTSGTLLEDLKNRIGQRAEITEPVCHGASLPKGTPEALQSADAWVFAFPLYVDGIPSHLLSCLIQLEEAGLGDPNVRIYGIVNCGFYEGKQGEPALEVLQNWCARTGFLWGGGVGVGGGGGLAMMPKTPPGQGPKAPIEEALGILAENILQGKRQDNRYVSVAVPRFLYKMGAQIGWRQMIKANGGRKKDLSKQPE